MVRQAQWNCRPKRAKYFSFARLYDFNLQQQKRVQKHKDKQTNKQKQLCAFGMYFGVWTNHYQVSCHGSFQWYPSCFSCDIWCIQHYTRRIEPAELQSPPTWPPILLLREIMCSFHVGAKHRHLYFLLIHIQSCFAFSGSPVSAQQSGLRETHGCCYRCCLCGGQNAPAINCRFLPTCQSKRTHAVGIWMQRCPDADKQPGQKNQVEGGMQSWVLSPIGEGGGSTPIHYIFVCVQVLAQIKTESNLPLSWIDLHQTSSSPFGQSLFPSHLFAQRPLEHWYSSQEPVFT